MSKKTVFRIKGIVKESQLPKILSFVPTPITLRCQQTFKAKKEAKLVQLGRKKRMSDSAKYLHLELRAGDEALMKKVYQDIKPYLIRDFTRL
ncbi:MAG: hypothetical protein ACI4VN_02755 [Clostridia bacterium]|nr:hypothetical protein [Clostridia bacterium]